MNYKVVLTNRLSRLLVSWNLPDAVFVEVHLRLRERLSQNPTAELVRATEPFDGMVYAFEMTDPANRVSVYRLFFHIIYGQDEETLYVVHGILLHSFGM